MVFATKKGISSYALARKLAIKEEIAWYLLQRLSRVAGTKHGRELSGLIEADETYIGGEGTKAGRSTDRILVRRLVEDKVSTYALCHARTRIMCSQSCWTGSTWIAA